MRRRAFFTCLGGAAIAWPLVAQAQQRERMRRIGFLIGLPADDAEGQARLAAFVQGLAELGWTVGRNLEMDYRAAGRDPDRYRKYAEELVALAPEVVLAGAPRPWRRCNRQPAPCRSYSRMSATIQPAPAISQDWL